MVRIKSERELKWEKEHAEEIKEEVRKMKEQNKKDMKALNDIKTKSGIMG